MKKRFLVAAMAATMGAASVAQADALLFPFYRANTDQRVFSFLSVANLDAVARNTHYIWNHSTDPNGNECLHDDAFGTMTAFDLVQQTVTDPNLFHGIDIPGFSQSSDGVTTDASAIQYSLDEPSLGFMIFANNNGEVAVANESTLIGQMITVDVLNGLITSQRGMNNPASTDEGNFASIFTSHPSYDLTWYDEDLITSTNWFVLVTGLGMDNPSAWRGAGNLTNGFINVFDRDENPRSGNIDIPIVCNALLSRAQLMSSAQLTWSAGGGYMWATFAPTAVTGATGILVTKTEFTPALGGTTTASLENPWPNLPF